jgi:transposase InsO family protein
MQTFGSIIPGAATLARLLPQGAAQAGKAKLEASREAKLSREGRHRLKVIRWHEEHGRNVTRTAERFGYSRATIHTWLKRYKSSGVAGLESRSHRPLQPRRPTWSQGLEHQVLELRQIYPRWGKDKLVVLLRKQGEQVSTSMVGRILKHLKDTRQLVEALPEPVRRKRDLPPRPYATRKPQGYFAKEPGEMVEVDTVDLRPLPGVVLKHFTARDVVSRWDVLGIYSRATANTASLFLQDLLARTPFEVKAIQVDGGSEFKAQFEAACRELGIRLFVLPPRSPKLNGAVERGNRTHRDEFYEVYDLDWTVQGIRPDLLWWEGIYNTVRPHVGLGYLTPQEYITQWRQGRPGKEVVYSIT